MREISVFDIIGPVMTGPSSSHTAGALKIASIARRLARKRITSVKFTLYGSFSETYRGHGTDKALLGGILGMKTDDTEIKHSYELAEKRGLKFSFEKGEITSDMHPNTVAIELTEEDGNVTRLIGSSVGGGDIDITGINDIRLSYSGRYNAIIVRQEDKPGVIAKISRLLEAGNVNIAFMQVYREAVGEDAVSLIEIDGELSPEALSGLNACEHVMGVRYIDVGSEVSAQ